MKPKKITQEEIDFLKVCLDRGVKNTGIECKMTHLVYDKLNDCWIYKIKMIYKINMSETL